MGTELTSIEQRETSNEIGGFKYIVCPVCGQITLASARFVLPGFRSCISECSSCKTRFEAGQKLSEGGRVWVTHEWHKLGTPVDVCGVQYEI